ncbi:MAG: hypothetical protein ABIO19_03765 [Burkholderiaceae bacterium]
MTEIRWETKRRYYAAKVYRDLFGDWIVESAWGGLHNKLGNRRQQVLQSYREAVGVLLEINRQRHARHYGIVASR